MTILMTGASGVLGRALLALLHEKGEPVVTISSIQTDLRDRDRTLSLVREISPRLIYHLAAKVHGLGGNSAFPAEMFIDNMRINSNIVEAANASGCEKIVAVSTVAIYASSAPKPVREDSIWDGRPHHSEEAYGHAKRAMLAQLEAFKAQYGLRFAYPILTNIYGPHDRFDSDHGHVIPSLVSKFFQSSRTGAPVSVWGTGVAERDFLYSEDAARALMLVAADHDGPINIASGKTVPIRTAVERLSAHSGVSDIRWDTTKPDGQLERSYDVSKIHALGFEPATSLAEGLAKTYDWYAEVYPDIRR